MNTRLPFSSDDTRSRILEAAVVRFGADGFGANLRAIAADVGLSAAAVLKHFDSKDGLRAATEQHVMGVISHYKQELLASEDTQGTFLEQMSHLEELQPYIRYWYRAMLGGGDIARTFSADLITEAAVWMRTGIEHGLIRPSRDEDARVKLTVAMSIGWMLLSVLEDGREIADLDADFWRRTSAAMILPTLELYSDGLLTDRSMLEEYLRYAPAPADQQEDTP